MIEKLYTVEEVAELASVTGRTIRNYLKSGRLIGRKIGGQWRFPENEVQLLLTGSASPAAAQAAEAPGPDGEQPLAAAHTAPPVPAPYPDIFDDDPRDPAEVAEAAQTEPPRADAYAVQRYAAEPAPLPVPAPPSPSQAQAAPAVSAPHIPTQAAAPYIPPVIPSAEPELPAAVPAKPQSAPQAEPQTAAHVSPCMAASAQGFAPPPAFYPPGYMPYAPGGAAPGGGYAQLPYYPYPFPYPFMQPVPPVYAPPFPMAAAAPAPEPQPIPAETQTAAPVPPAEEPPPAEAGPPPEAPPVEAAPPEEEPAAEAQQTAEEQPPAEPQPPAPAETGRPSHAMPELSEVGRRAAKFISQVHDCSHGPQVCAVVDLYQSLLAARSTATRLADIADEESAAGTPCQSFVEFDDRYFVARHTLLGSSAFLLRCLKLIG